MQRDKSYRWLALLLALLFVTPLASWAREAEELLAEINRLPPKEREVKLIEGAKKEGSLNWYGNIEIIRKQR
ncbi:MAG: hypothetical protein HY694_07305 [Deltaproteobacteria bacterium]|nr:hypothetical protein [Deltaproteobacteria bacterium]